MAELADAGAAAFTDDGRPVTSAGLMRRALQYGAVTGRKLALHCEEPTLSRDGQVHEGPVSRRARLRPVSLGCGERDGRARPVARGLRARGRSTSCTSPRRSRSTPCAPHTRAGSTASAEVTPHHLVPHRRGRSLARPEREDESAAEGGRGPQGADRGTSRRHDRVRRDRPRASLPRGEGSAVRGGAVRRHRARDRVRGALHPSRRAGGASRSRRCSSGCPPGLLVRSACPSRGSRSARAPISSCSTSRRSGRSRRGASAPARRTPGSSASACAAPL